MYRPIAFARRYIRLTRERDTCLIHVGPIILSESTIANFFLPVIILKVVLGTILFISHARLLACRGARP